MKRILILENDWSNLSYLKDLLTNKGYCISCVQSIKRTEFLLGENNFDLLLCERFLLDGDVLDLLEDIKARKLFMRVLVISSEKSLVDRINILKFADDFLAKPFNQIELLLKIKNLLNLERIGDDNFLENSLMIFKDGAGSNYECHFRPQELKILECLFKHKNMIISYETISSFVWGYKEELPLKKTINVYIRRIRSKLVPEKYKILTIRNRGYKFIELMEKNI